ncbi:hypothetical protein DL96DRAFT_1138102 [Flagelloscypha sp. PMI_526]|nr:hypothetical protein DL96DRAFT_1138102 [Flagelloscypha sp. PMI_526]
MLSRVSKVQLRVGRFVSVMHRPAPPPLPKEDQREFENLVRQAQSVNAGSQPDTALLHPDALKPVVPDFQGDTNPLTGETGGPTKEPVGKWSKEPDAGDWSFKGRVSDF